MKLGTVVDMLISSSRWYRPPVWMVRHWRVLYLPWISAGINNKQALGISIPFHKNLISNWYDLNVI